MINKHNKHRFCGAFLFLLTICVLYAKIIINEKQKEFKMEIIKEKVFDCERALYESEDISVINCRFEGEADGESALKESKNILARGCFFDLRYPFWHDEKADIINCEMTENCRAPLWYSKHVSIKDSKLWGVKALRECEKIKIDSCHIVSGEFGWDNTDVSITSSYVKGEYFMARSKNLSFTNLQMEGKYSFQYIENAVLDGCDLNTKYAFWHAKNVTVRNCTVKGEYLGWYSENLTFENCIIIGTQPLCYCKNLTLINCEMHGCDLSFEKSYVQAQITTPILSVKNVLGGKITAPRVDEIIKDKEEYKGVVVEDEKL